MFVFAIFGILFSLEKEDGFFRPSHIIIVALFSSSISFGLSYYIYTKYNIYLYNIVLFTLASIVGFLFEHFTTKQILDGIKNLKNLRVTFKNNKKGGN